MTDLQIGDCNKLLKSIPDKSVDFLLTDPPYNVSRPNNFKTIGNANRIGMDFGEWDKDFDIIGWIKYAAKTLRENANVVIFNSWENLSLIKEECEKNHIMIKRCLVLSKSNPAPFNKDRMFVNDVEFALWGVYNSKNKPTKWTFNRINALEKCVINTTVQSSKLHPTMKDIKVIKYLVQLLSNNGDTVLDPFMGSGTTGVACKLLQRSFIGIEINRDYFNIAKERINRLNNEQLSLES